MPLLHLWQEHFGFISDEAVLSIAEKLGLQPINILELVTFYPMFRQKSPGKTHIRWQFRADGKFMRDTWDSTST